MRFLGSVLLAFGIFFLFVAGVAVAAPNLRANGIALAAMTTSVVGTALIGSLAVVAGALLRRRGLEARRERERASALRSPEQPALATPPMREVTASSAATMRESDRP
jgi:hypothetical protein